MHFAIGLAPHKLKIKMLLACVNNSPVYIISEDDTEDKSFEASPSSVLTKLETYAFFAFPNYIHNKNKEEMLKIQQFRFHGNSIKCIVSDSGIGFLANQVANLRGYARPSKAVFDHAPKMYKQVIWSLSF